MLIPAREIPNEAVRGAAHLRGEFLSWLYFAAGHGLDLAFADDVAALLPDKPEVAVSTGHALSLIGVDGTKVRITGNVTRTDALEALGIGSTVCALALAVYVGQRAYSFTLDASGVLSGISLPVGVDTEAEAGDEGVDTALAPKPSKRPKLPLEDLIAVHTAMLDELDLVVGAMLAVFAARRCDPVAWAEAEAKMAAIMRGDG